MSEHVDELLRSNRFVYVYRKSSRVVSMVSYDKTGITRVSAVQGWREFLGFKNGDFSLSSKALFLTLRGIILLKSTG